jgi:D-lactate dehydrogenase (cytochrome)
MPAETAERRNSVQQAIAEIAQVLGERLSTSQAVRDQHGKDTTWNPGHAPDAVAFVNNTEEVQKVVQVCARYEVPVIAHGTGTSLEGHITAPHGGICINVMNMNQVLEVNTMDFDVRVQPGVTRKQLNEYICATPGLFFPIDPGADASLGGMAATRASGTNAVRYGTMRDNVLGLTACWPTAASCAPAPAPRKSSAGYDLTRLLVGSEGTLGIITELTLRSMASRRRCRRRLCPFPTVAAA